MCGYGIVIDMRIFFGVAGVTETLYPNLNLQIRKYTHRPNCQPTWPQTPNPDSIWVCCIIKVFSLSPSPVFPIWDFETKKLHDVVATPKPRNNRLRYMLAILKLMTLSCTALLLFFDTSNQVMTSSPVLPKLIPRDATHARD